MASREHSSSHGLSPGRADCLYAHAFGRAGLDRFQHGPDLRQPALLSRALMAALGISLSWASWRSVSTSFQQITLIWLAGIAVAIVAASTAHSGRRRDRRSLSHQARSAGHSGVLPVHAEVPRGDRGGDRLDRRWAVLLALSRSVRPLPGNEPAEPVDANHAAGQRLGLRARLRSSAGGFGLAALLAYAGFLVWRNRKAIFVPAQSPDYSFF